MTLLLATMSRGTSAFISKSHFTPAKTALQAGFFENLTSSFSTLAENNKNNGNKSSYTVAITGSSGLIGSALIDELTKTASVQKKKPEILRLVRGSNSKNVGDDGIVWDPSSTTTALDPALLEGVDAVVHLAGENVSTGGFLGLGLRPWTEEKKSEILRSRDDATRALAAAVREASQQQNRKIDFICASGIGIYGDDFIGESAVVADESTDTSSTKGFLAEISRKWEAAAGTAASNKNSRVVNLRFGVVLSKLGGALQKLYPIFLVGGGGNVGSGDQYFTYISARDATRAVVHVLDTPKLAGPINISANACTNAEFTKALGKVLKRPTILPLPSFAVSLLFGQMGEEMLLGGVRAQPSKLLESGFQFKHDTIEKALASAIDEENI